MSANSPSTLCSVIKDILAVGDLPRCWVFVGGMISRGWVDVHPVYDPPVRDGKFDTTIIGRWNGNECEAMEMIQRERLLWSDLKVVVI